MFTASPTTAGVNQNITFTADTSNITGPVNWDFGNGQHCEQCAYSVVTAYSSSGTFQARLTATITGSSCTPTSKVSGPQAMTIQGGGGGPGGGKDPDP